MRLLPPAPTGEIRSPFWRAIVAMISAGLGGNSPKRDFTGAHKIHAQHASASSAEQAATKPGPRQHVNQDAEAASRKRALVGPVPSEMQEFDLR